ncbi:dihydrofolate reductase [Marivirga atlantica]|jgi:dihydrofolate reductase|uniref:Dihydrofolate reductase n=1 Tax=Marivirga atlantica TaxID=1548457 RepID=A0A937DGW7_9BACT|nr:dihydrofolate reductase [Marivirga atlantica]MBL0765228.1 dihydrofolate reductase [Marivirga atlantica]
MTISMIVARAQNGAIGKDNDMIWSLPDDMKYFKDTTRNHHVLMGRKNFDSLPDSFRPLKNRVNIVITRNKDWSFDGTQVFHDVASGIDYARTNNEEELFVIGGGEIYKQCLPHADRLYITEVYAEFPDADAYFPDVDLSEWKEVSRKKHPKDEKHKYAFDFVVYERS